METKDPMFVKYEHPDFELITKKSGPLIAVKKTEHKFEQLDGGLRTKLAPPWHVDIIIDTCRSTIDEDCLKEIYCLKSNYKLNENRLHFRMFESIKSLVYIPIEIPHISMPSKWGHMSWHYDVGKWRPDQQFCAHINKAIKCLSHKWNSCDMQVEFFIINYCVLNFRYLNPEIKHEALQLIAKIVIKQKNLLYVILENAQLDLTDGLRILLILGTACGETIMSLRLWYFFQKGQLPIKGPEYTIHDKFVYHRENDVRPSDDDRQELWKKIVWTTDFGSIPIEEQPRLYTMALLLFENITELYVHYSWLAQKQGEPLCQLGCVRFGKLKYLHLLYSMKETVEEVQQLISRSAWKYALHYCPKLQLTLTLVGIAHYNLFKPVITDNLPLVAFHMFKGLTFEEVGSYKPPWVGCILRTLRTHFQKSLKKISVQLWHPHQRIDLALCQLLTDLPLLEEFEYQGPLDKSETVHEICNFLLNYKHRIKKLHIMLQGDPCNIVPWEKFVLSIRKKYKEVLAARNVDFSFDLFKV